SFGAEEWIDLLARKGYAVENGVAKVTLPPQQGIALRPQSQVTVKPLAQNGGQSTAPSSIRGVSEWELGDETIKTDSWLELKSTDENTPALATLQSEPLQHNVALHLKLKAAPDAIWQIDVG